MGLLCGERAPAGPLSGSSPELHGSSSRWGAQEASPPGLLCPLGWGGGPGGRHPHPFHSCRAGAGVGAGKGRCC